MNKLIFTDSGSLTAWEPLGEMIIYPRPEDGHGGAFWCLPNFDEGVPPFTKRHGEYRNTKEEICGDESVKNISGPWGSLSIMTNWKNDETMLESSVALLSTNHETFIRPGFHPYIALSEEEDAYEFLINGKVITSPEIEVSQKLLIPCNEESGEVTALFSSPKKKISITFAVSPQEKENSSKSFAFCLWTDKKDSYICCEPVLGHGYDQDGMPKPYTLTLNERASLKVTIKILE